MTQKTNEKHWHNMNGEKKQQHKNSTRDEIAPESYHVHIEKKIMIHRKCSIKVQLFKSWWDGKYRSDMYVYMSFGTASVHCSEFKWKICIFNFSTRSANKTFTKPGGLAFLQCDRHVKIAIVMSQGGQTTTQINFFIKIKVKKLWRENTNCQCF